MISSLEEFRAYNHALDLGKRIWDLVLRWGYFEKDTIGKQLVKSADSIAANLSEGLGRYHFKEIKNFSYFARGSLFETKTWLSKAFERNLITNEEFEIFKKDLDSLGRMLNSYINSIGDVNEPTENYLPRNDK